MFSQYVLPQQMPLPAAETKTTLLLSTISFTITLGRNGKLVEPRQPQLAFTTLTPFLWDITTIPAISSFHELKTYLHLLPAKDARPLPLLVCAIAVPATAVP